MGQRQIPIEMRFIDLFMLVVGALVCILFIISDDKNTPPGYYAGRDSKEFLIPKLEIVTRELPVALKGVPYELTLSATGGHGIYTWHADDGVLSKGLQLDSKTGLISGTPEELGTKIFSIQLADEHGGSVSQELILHVRGKNIETKYLCMIANTLELPEAVETEPYMFMLNTAGGSPPYRWRILKGTLPPGLYLELGGVIKGTLRPYPSGSSVRAHCKVRVAVTDSAGAYLEQMLVIPIKPKPIGTARSNNALSQIARVIVKIISCIVLFNIAVLLLLFLCGFQGGVVNRERGLLRSKDDYKI